MPAADPSPVKVDVYMPWYVGDYLTSTALMSTEEHGAYSLLLMHMWSQGGMLPLEHDRLARVARVSDPDKWAEIWRVIQVRFMPAPDRPGHIIQRRLAVELVKARELKVAATDRGRAGAEGRWGTRRAKPQETEPAAPEPAAPAGARTDAQAMPEHMPEQCSPISNHQAKDPDPERARAGPDAGAWPEQKSGTVHQLVLRARGQPSLCDFHVGGANAGRPAIPPRDACGECRRARQLGTRAGPRRAARPQTADEILEAGGWPPRGEGQRELFSHRRGP